MAVSDYDSYGLIRALLYPIQFENTLTDGLDRVIEVVVDEQVMGVVREDYAQAIAMRLKGSEPLASLVGIDEREAEVRNFLRALHDKLVDASAS